MYEINSAENGKPPSFCMSAIINSFKEKTSSVVKTDGTGVFENVGTKSGIEIWEIQESKIQKIERESYNFQNNVNYGYILLQTMENSQEDKKFLFLYTIRYLIAKYLKIEIKYKVVDYVKQLWNAIKPTASDGININRNDYIEETDRPYNFIRHFSDLSHHESFPRRRLYKVTINEKKILIIQVSPKFSELTQRDVFVFDSDRVIYIFCRRHWTKEAQRTLPVAQKLAEFMNINENSGTKDILFNFQAKRRYGPKAPPQEHLKYLKGYPAEPDSQTDYIYRSLPDTIITDTTEDIIRYTYPDITDKYEEIPYLRSRMIKFNETSYILKNERLMYVFIYIRPNPDSKELNTILKRGELLASYGYVIATVQKHNLLTDFILAFEDLVQCFTENENDNVFRIMEKIFDKLQ